VPTSVYRSPSGINVRQKNGSIIALDPSRSSDSDFTFISHAHVDHLHRSRKDSKSRLIASKETSLLAGARGYEIVRATDHLDGFELVDTGHILGSRGLLIGDEVYYTGDLSTRQRAFLRPAKVPHASILIIESTFGRPEYVFPALDDVVHRTNKIISEMYNMGVPVILMGYALGKAQLLTKFFGHWDPVYVHDSVAAMNTLHSELGIDLKSSVSCSQVENDGLLSKHRPWVMVAPLMHGRNAFVKKMKEKYGAITIGFSGWAAGSGYRFMMGLDYVMPLSDHCDYNELVQAVKQCNPDQVYTFHGFAAEFAQSLRKMGFDAQTIGEKGKERVPSLDSFQ
jgi:putative mRNA 3-end processing factor